MAGNYRRFAWRPNHGSEQPCRMVIYDTETTAVQRLRETAVYDHKLRCGVASFWRRNGTNWSKRGECVFNDVHEFWQFVYSRCKQREPLWVYSHNQAFDFTIVRGWDELQAGRIVLFATGRIYKKSGDDTERKTRDYRGLLAVDGIPFIVEGRTNRGSLKIVDTLNYIPVSLSKLARWCGLTKWKLPNAKASDSDWVSYCRNDVSILESAVLRLLRLWSGDSLGTWQTTIGRLAYSSFRHTSPNSGIVSHGDEPHNPDPVITDEWRRTAKTLDAGEVARVERSAYFGGQTIVNFMGDITAPNDARYDRRVASGTGTRPNLVGPVTVFDVNGLYPTVMRIQSFPIEIIDSIRQPSHPEACKLIEQFDCVADVLIDTSKRTYPYRQERRIAWPTGRYVTSLAGPELRAAIANDDAIQVSNLCIYHSGKPFVAFIEYWNAIKEAAIKDGDECSAMLAKLIMNALFGKLGQRRPTWNLCPSIPPLTAYGAFVRYCNKSKTFKKYRSVARVVQEEGERRECNHTMTATAACITAHARAYMDKLRAQCPERSVLYQGTDSLFTLPAGTASIKKSGMVCQHELGKMKVTGTYDDVSIYAPKVYRVDGKIVAAGLAGNAVELGDGRFQQTNFESGGSIITRNQDGTVKTWQSIWHTPGRTLPASVGWDGWTRPLCIRIERSEIEQVAQSHGVALLNAVH